jgi:lipoprotein-anchoring transpeptidase ErfK/SrfK
MLKAFAVLILSISVAQASQIHIPAIDDVQADTVTDASEAQTIANRAEVADETLDEGLTPEEIAQEFQITGDSYFKTAVAYSNRLYILVNKAESGTSPTAQTMQVYLDGQLIYNFAVSTGRERPEIAKSGKRYISSTPTGDFRIQRRSKNHYSSTWLAPMPYAQFFVGGIAIHATVPSHYKALGHRDSGGCVRLHLDNAKIMWDLVDRVGANNVLIRVVNQAN